ncbi:hypothetical protein J4217_04870 [Candidatus Pacearchaeota archaeon]|nr:hypothetical protein [Candidatus Pacearchaeota archaeon]
MKLENKKDLVARTLGVGKRRIIFHNARLLEIKEAITKQDIRDLVKEGAIILRPIMGRKKIVKRKYRRHAGKIRMKVVDKKRKYILITRKLRKYLAVLRKTEKISDEDYMKLRKEIKASSFRDMAHFRERISQI